MKFDDILAPKISLRVKAKDVTIKLCQSDVLSVNTSRLRGEFDLLTTEVFITVVPLEHADVNRLTDAVSTGRAILARLSDPDAIGGALLTLLMFGGEPLEMGELEIGVDERVVSILRKSSLDEAAKAMWGQSVLMHGGKSYFIMVAGAATKDYLENQDSERQFAVIGKDIRYALSERDKGNGETVFLASGITKIRNRHEDPALRLACGNLRFVDWTKAGQRAVIAKAQLDAIMQDVGGYLKKWDEFGKVEGDMFLERARAVGKVAFDIIEERRDGTVLVKCKALTKIQTDALAGVREVDVVGNDNIPAYLSNLMMTFEEFSCGVVDDAKVNELLGEKKLGRHKYPAHKFQTLQVQNFNKATGEIILIAQSAPVGCWIIHSVAGEVAQMERRAKARNAIQCGRAANPELGLLIEEGGKITPTQPPPKIKALTAFVRNKVFPRNPPTDTQEEAIRIALNTPDIALIQGPPGTGKTTVIAAIIERLNEESDKREKISGRILLSGFQHDAVENMINKLRLNGLPIPKFGQRNGDLRNDDLSRFEDRLKKWCEEHTKELRKRNPQISESLEEQDIRSMCVQYINAPSLSIAKTLLETSLKLPSKTLTESLVEKLQMELRRLKAERINAMSDKINVARGIRSTEDGFGDDGPDRAADALCFFNGDLTDSEIDLLNQASRYNKNDGAPKFLKKLHELRIALLKRYTPVPVFRTEKIRDSVVMLIKDVLSQIRENGISVRDMKTAALAELLFEMENNPNGIINAVRDYSFAFAATCQQSVNMTMLEMKGINSDTPDTKLDYDFVIIDEAARVSPRDLMIPMAQGKRIILVGDHRQLPQLVDEEVARRMEEGVEADAEENTWLKKSMFEYLFTERIPKLEALDGVIRHITLDRQYRMHKDLGDFISRNFYERFGERRVESGLSAEYFVHDLPDTKGRCAAWIDVPHEDGGMVKFETSWTRPSEVVAICHRLQDWVNFDNSREQNPDKRLTFGVISFYKAQAELIKKRLGDKFLDEVGGERLRIGTVDSFQGMEFDVVFLSLVRTWQGKRPQTGVKSRQQFGFLKLYNRLNVSMSRQKRILVAVGDVAFYETDVAKVQVPALYDYLKLCREKGVVL